MKTCIAVVDASRARLFTFDRDAEPSGLRERMTETRDLVNPARRRTPSELFTESGRADDNRDAHIDHMDTDFARAIVDEIATGTRDLACHKLVLCASPRMLGMLRKLIAPLEREGLAVEEIARDLVKLTPAQLRTHLAKGGALPPIPPRDQRAH